MADIGDNPFGLFGNDDDPFAPGAQAAPPVAAALPEGAPPLQTPGFVTEERFNALQAEQERLKPLAWIGEAIAADPQMAARLRQAVFAAGAGAGAPTNVAPINPGAGALEALKAERDAKIQAGDFAGALDVTAKMGAAQARAEMLPEIMQAAGPMISLSGQNAIEAWYNAKRQSSPMFKHVESKVRAFVAQTPPQALAGLVQSGQITAALENAYFKIVGESQEQAYNKAVQDGRIRPQAAQTPPPYAGGSAGPIPSGGAPPAEDDADDKAFNEMAAAKGIKFTMGANGAMVGELR